MKEAAASVAGIKDFDAQYARALTLVKTDAGLGALLGAKSTPTFIINGHVIAGALPVPYFEAAIQQEISDSTRRPDRREWCAGRAFRDDRRAPSRRHRRSRSSNPMPAAIRIEDLTKDYWVGFWRKRPYRALERLSLEVRAARSSAFSVRTARARRRRSSC